jgi:hypothetical protein
MRRRTAPRVTRAASPSTDRLLSCYEQAATLAAVVDVGPYPYVNRWDSEEFQRTQREARAALGDASYEAILTRGSSLALDAALAYARKELGRVLEEHRPGTAGA